MFERKFERKKKCTEYSVLLHTMLVRFLEEGNTDLMFKNCWEGDRNSDRHRYAKFHSCYIYQLEEGVFILLDLRENILCVHNIYLCNIKRLQFC